MQCPNCSAVMSIINKPDGTIIYHCDYCGNTIEEKPKGVGDKFFGLLNNLANSREQNYSQQEDKYLHLDRRRYI